MNEIHATVAPAVLGYAKWTPQGSTAEGPLVDAQDQPIGVWWTVGLSDRIWCSYGYYRMRAIRATIDGREYWGRFNDEWDAVILRPVK